MEYEYRYLFVKRNLFVYILLYVICDVLPLGTSTGSAKQAPMNLLANRGNLDSAVLRNSWFRQLFVRDTEKRGVYEGPFVDIFDELQARATKTQISVLSQALITFSCSRLSLISKCKMSHQPNPCQEPE